MESREYSCDVLVIGGGIAGLFAAITAREQSSSVILADKAYAGKSGSSIMGSGQLNLHDPNGSRQRDWVRKKIIETGENLVHQDWMDVMIDDSWGIYLNMLDWGVEFPCTAENYTEYMNSVHAWEDNGKDAPEVPLGMIPLKHREVPPKLRNYAQKTGVRLIDRVMVTELISKDGRVCGAVAFDIETAQPVVIRSGAVVLAGGKNGFRAPGMNIAELTGDADAMAYRAGADISGKEFPDLHVNIERNPVWKGCGEIYPAYWNFTDGGGKPIPMMGFDLSMVSVVHAGKGPVIWDFENMTEKDREKIENYRAKRGVPFETERVGLGYQTGKNERMIGGSAGGSMAEQSAGIWPADLSCASTVPGLYSVGDCCATWAWGAINAGAPPGLLPAAVTGRRAGKGAADAAGSCEGAGPDKQLDERLTNEMLAPLRRKTGFDPRWVCQLLQNTMLPYFIIHIKHEKRLQSALTMVEFFRDHMTPLLKAEDAHELRLCHEVRNMVLNAEMILRSSLARTESRGWHYREDFPRQDDDNWLAWIRLSLSDGGMAVKKHEIPDKWKPKSARGPRERYGNKWLAWEQEG